MSSLYGKSHKFVYFEIFQKEKNKNSYLGMYHTYAAALVVLVKQFFKIDNLITYIDNIYRNHMSNNYYIILRNYVGKFD